MSADNGIYIGQFPSNNGFEFRVIHAQAIENCDDNVGCSQREIDLYRVLYYKDAIVFNNYEHALQYAKDLSVDYDYLEYGICHMAYLRPLLNISKQEAEKELFPNEREIVLTSSF